MYKIWNFADMVCNKWWPIDIVLENSLNQYLAFMLTQVLLVTAFKPWWYATSAPEVKLKDILLKHAAVCGIVAYMHAVALQEKNPTNNTLQRKYLEIIEKLCKIITILFWISLEPKRAG